MVCILPDVSIRCSFDDTVRENVVDQEDLVSARLQSDFQNEFLVVPSRRTTNHGTLTAK
jgi:hypothetical protein